MRTYLVLTAAMVLLTGLAVLWANPKRLSNQVFAFGAFLITFWFVLVYQTYITNVQLRAGLVADPIKWHRANAAVAGFIPITVWLIVSSIEKGAFPKLVRDGLIIWLPITSSLVILAYSDSFIFLNTNQLTHTRGSNYVIYNVLAGFSFLYLLFQTLSALRRQSGIRKLELRFLALSLIIAGIICVSGNAIAAIFHVKIVPRINPAIILIAYTSSAYGIAVYRIYDVREFYTRLGRHLLLLSVFLIGGFFISYFIEASSEHTFSIALAVGIFGIAVLWLDQQSRNWLGLTETGRLTKARTRVIEIAQEDVRPSHLAGKFEGFLCDHCQCESAAVAVEHKQAFCSTTLTFRKDNPAFAALCNLGWITPESFQRRRTNPALEALNSYIISNELALIVTAPRGSSNPSLLVAFGPKVNEAPFTYPEVERLQNIAELMDNILTHAHLAAQAALQAKLEHLALMSRGLAHDLKNLITPVSSFLIHTDGHFPPNSAAAEVHAMARRSVTVMTDYVREALFFADQLQPKFETVDISHVLSAVVEVTLDRARVRRVSVSATCAHISPLVADRVLLQRMLANLVHNAIDASRPGLEVALAADTSADERVRLQVSDRGCGIPRENLNRIFEPYFTTKQFGEEVRGFGLGLTICQKIVHLHGGVISVNSQLGEGTQFTVELPFHPGSTRNVNASP